MNVTALTPAARRAQNDAFFGAHKIPHITSRKNDTERVRAVTTTERRARIKY